MSRKDTDVGDEAPKGKAGIISQDYRNRCYSWYKGYRRFEAIYYILGFIVTVGGVLVASQSISANWSRAIGLMVAIASAITTLAQPKSISDRCRRAWIEMDCAIKALEGVDQSLVVTARRVEDVLSEGATKERYENYKKKAEKNEHFGGPRVGNAGDEAKSFE